MLNAEVAVGCVLIILARVADVSLGTVRTICVVQGRARLAWLTGFFEVLIWLFAVSKVIQNLSSPIYAVAYAFGYATGNFAGIKLDEWLGWGSQVVRVFTRRSKELAAALRDEGFPLTEFTGTGREGPVSMLFIEVRRKSVRRLVERILKLDRDSYYLVDDIRQVASPAGVRFQPTGWRTVVKRK